MHFHVNATDRPEVKAVLKTLLKTPPPKISGMTDASAMALLFEKALRVNGLHKSQKHGFLYFVGEGVRIRIDRQSFTEAFGAAFEKYPKTDSVRSRGRKSPDNDFGSEVFSKLTDANQIIFES